MNEKIIDQNYAKALRDVANVPVEKDSDFELALPEWYDDEKYKRAQKFYKTNLFATLLMNLCGLISILAVPSILRVLIHTKKSSTTMTAYRRYLATVFYTINFYEYDLTPGSVSWKSLAAVRKMHCSASKSSEKACCGVISQKDMAITQFGFMGFGVLRPDFLGLKRTQEDMEAFVHFWRVMGFMLGIKDEYNLCTDSLETTILRSRTVLNEFLLEGLENPTQDFLEMSRYVIDGLWCMEPTLRYESIMFLTHRFAGMRYYHYFDCEIENEPDKEDLKRKSCLENLDGYSKFLVGLHVVFLQNLYQYALVRWYYNQQVLFNRFLMKYFPFLAIYMYGIKNAYVRIFK